MNAPDYGYYSSEQFATQVAKGAISLGIDISPALQLSLVDQHGCLIGREPVYATAEEREQFLRGPQSLGIKASEGSESESYQFKYENWGINRDLAGIGAQFERRGG
jgi:hypothetical protein